MNTAIENLVNSTNICLRCIGRAIGSKGSSELDSSVQSAMKLPADLITQCVPETHCTLCRGLVSKAIDYTRTIIDTIKDLEFDNFLVGCSLDGFEVADSVLERVSSSVISIKFEIRKELGLRITKSLEKPVEFDQPDLSIIYYANNMKHDLQIKSLYLLGRYQKLERGIPQTKWPCTHCKGRGCSTCDGSGQQYPTSVEHEISAGFVAASQADDSSFHGAGREDIDALMLGTGRPFVLELKNPKKRDLDLEHLSQRVNESSKVMILDMRYTDKDMVAFLKQGSGNAWKTYRALVETKDPVTISECDRLNEWGTISHVLQQRTPQRVSHRRANKVREKEIYSVTSKLINDHTLELEIHAQGGAYIKEFISGDDGRTTPNVAEILGTGAICTALDVIGVDDRGVFDDS